MSKRLLLTPSVMRPKLTRNMTMSNLSVRQRSPVQSGNVLASSLEYNKKKKDLDIAYERIEYKKYIRQVWSQWIERLYLAEGEKNKKRRKLRRKLWEMENEVQGLSNIVSTTSLVGHGKKKKRGSQNPNNLQEDIHEFGKEQKQKYTRFRQFVKTGLAKELFSSNLKYITSLLKIEKLKLRIRVSKIDLAKKVRIGESKAIGPKRRTVLEKEKLLLRKSIQRDRSKMKKEKTECFVLLKTCSACYSYVLISQKFCKITEQVEEKRFFDVFSFFLVHMVTLRIESKKLHPFVESEINRLFRLNFFPTMEQNKRARKFVKLRDLHRKKLEDYGRVKPPKHGFRLSEAKRPRTSIGRRMRERKRRPSSTRGRRPNTSSGTRRRGRSKSVLKKKSTPKRPKTSHGFRRILNRNRGDFISKGRERLRFSYYQHKEHGGNEGVGIYRIKPEAKMKFMFDRSPLISVLYPRDEEKKFNVFNPFREEANVMLNLEEEKKKDPFVFPIPTKTLLAIGREQEIKLSEKKKKRRGRSKVVYSKHNFS